MAGAGARRVFVSAVLLAAGVTVFPSPARAACHAFTVEVSPSHPDEGTTVTVTVRRDGNVAPSQVDVRTVDGTAKAGSDYTGLSQQTASFTTETQKTYSVPVLSDGVSEPDETFQVQLSDPGGSACAGPYGFSVGYPATVTIEGDQQAPPSSSTSTPTTAPSSSQNQNQTQGQSQGRESGSQGGTATGSGGSASGDEQGTAQGGGAEHRYEPGGITGPYTTGPSTTFGTGTTTSVTALATGDVPGRGAGGPGGITVTGDEAASLSPAGDDDGVPVGLAGLAAVVLLIAATAVLGYAWLFRPLTPGR